MPKAVGSTNVAISENPACRQARHVAIFVSLALSLTAAGAGIYPRKESPTGRQQGQDRLRIRRFPSPQTELDLKNIPFKIVYETYRQTNGKLNWELYMINADGSEQVNLTNTPDLDEMYPHVSPDGTKICFVVDKPTGQTMLRSVYYMDIEGTSRVKVADDARQPCWSFDSKSIAYLRQEFERYTTREYATSELVIYDLETGLHRPHPNRTLHHLYAICWSPYGRWFVAAVHGGMGYSDTILAFQADGTNVFDLGQWGVKGCRPDLSSDGRKMVWGETDWNLRIADIDLSGREPRVWDTQDIVRCARRSKIYHVDLSPDGRYVTFSYGPFRGGQQVGGKAKGWDICVSDMSGKWVKITTDGHHNKEPDWVPLVSATRLGEASRSRERAVAGRAEP
jgi:Tol biopolymer transport system component